MENDNSVLGGFSAIFDSIMPNDTIKIKGVELIPSSDDPDTVLRSPFDMDLGDDDIETPIPGKDDIDIEGDIKDDEPVDKEDLEDKTVDKELEKDDNTLQVVTDENETTQVTAFFDAIAEQVGWGTVADEEKPKSVEEFVSYMKDAVEASSVPSYANDEIAELDEYIKNGGSVQDFYNSVSNVDYDSIDLSDVDNQKSIVKEFLSEKGFSDIQIKRKLEKYEDADLLEDEASDAIEFLKESKEENRKALLESQKTAYTDSIDKQQKFYNSVVSEIEALTDVRGIKIPKEEKKPFIEFLLKTDQDGKTGYQKKYSESATKNLIESAYFTWKGDTLIDRAKRDGETSATERLKNTLKTNKVSGSKQTINNGSPTPLWSLASRQLLRRPQ